MYLEFFRLEKYPFHVTPDPEFLFLSPSHKEALASIIYGVEEKKGFVAIIGEVGVGKTTILRSYLERADRNQLKTIYVFNANISFKSLLKTVGHELGVAFETDDYFEIVPKLHGALIEEYRQGHNVVLIIDEAQNMPVETLENLRMLSNLETTTDKLIQIVLCGQVELEDMLNRHDLRALSQRISIKTHVLPFSFPESMEYIRHRLSRAGRKDGLLFATDAMNRIVKRSKGIPRTINILCDNCLITAYGLRQEKVTGKIAKEIIGDHYRGRIPVLGRWRIALLVLLVLLVAITGGALLYRNDELNSSLFASSVKNAPHGQDHGDPAEGKNATPGTLRNPQPTTASADGGRIERGKAAARSGIPISRGKSSSARRTVKSGDTVFTLSQEVYGFANDEMVRWIKEVNPWMRDADKIAVGDSIYFPELNKKPESKSRKQ